MTEYEQVLCVLSGRTSQAKALLQLLDAELSMPNVPTPTMGGEVFWNTIAQYNGWKLQQNMITHHARILDGHDVRIAWGTINGMKKAMDRLVEGLHRYEEDPEAASDRRMNTMDEMKKLKELLDIGAITEEEYEQKKRKFLKQI